MDRYEEALEKARAGKSLEEIFPELKESEDERVRDDIMEAVENWLPYKRVEEIRAYLRKQKEQKFTEKQDYSDLTDLERAIHRGFLVVGVENVPVAIIKETAQDCLAWMKPAEWSEKDERLLSKLELYVDMECFDRECNGEDLRNWLKSLRPQPHWKPSEEQMGTLKQWIQDHELDGDTRDVYPIFYSLFADLQKLL